MTEESSNSGKGKPSKKGNVPVADVNFGNVVTSVSEKWVANDWLTLRWLKVDAFQADAASYNTILEARLEQGAGRSQITEAIRTLDKSITDALSYVKGYIVDKYKKESATSYYAAFGIEHKNNKHVFPKDQNKRIAALKLMIKALNANGFADKEFGVAFWTAIQVQYALLVKDATDTAGGVSIKVGDKNALKRNLKKGLKAIVFALKANYPDTYKQELRDWGFQKEKY